MARAPTARSADPSFNLFFSNTYQRVVALVAVTTGDAVLAKDTVEEAYGLALRRWTGVRQMERPDVWVTRVAMRTAIDAWTKKRAATVNDGELTRWVPANVRRLWARWHLEELAPNQRAALLLRYLEGSHIGEAAQDSSVPWRPSAPSQTPQAAGLIW